MAIIVLWRNSSYHNLHPIRRVPTKNSLVSIVPDKYKIYGGVPTNPTSSHQCCGYRSGSKFDPCSANLWLWMWIRISIQTRARIWIQIWGKFPELKYNVLGSTHSLKLNATSLAFSSFKVIYLLNKCFSATNCNVDVQ